MFKTSNVNVVVGSCVKGEAALCGGLLLAILVFAAMMWIGTTTVLATRITSFSQAGDFSTSCSLRMNSNDNLLWVSVLGGTPTSINPDYLAGNWHLGLTDDQGFVVGWATNSSKSSSGHEGFLAGKYSGIVDNQFNHGLVNGEKPTHAFLVYDSLVGLGGAGWDIVNGIVGSPKDLLDGDLFFTEADIIFGLDTVTGDVSELPSFPISGSAYLPKMTVVIPEPATICVLALGGLSVIRKRRSLK